MGRVVIIACVIFGVCSTLAGVLLAGYVRPGSLTVGKGYDRQFHRCSNDRRDHFQWRSGKRSVEAFPSKGTSPNSDETRDLARKREAH